jgi:hypothetical protein
LPKNVCDRHISDEKQAHVHEKNQVNDHFGLFVDFSIPNGHEHPYKKWFPNKTQN